MAVQYTVQYFQKKAVEQRHSTPFPLGGSGSVSAVQNGYAGQLQLHNAGLFNRLGIIELTLLLRVSIKRFASVKVNPLIANSSNV